jgi:hypothetical protein
MAGFPLEGSSELPFVMNVTKAGEKHHRRRVAVHAQ